MFLGSGLLLSEYIWYYTLGRQHRAWVTIRNGWVPRTPRCVACLHAEPRTKRVRVNGLGRRDENVGCRVWGVGCWVWGVGCGVWGVGCGLLSVGRGV